MAPQPVLNQRIPPPRLRHNQNAERDPTRTKTLRDNFASQMSKRFRWLRGRIREAIVDLDVLGLRNQQTNLEYQPPRQGQFDFPRNEMKVEEFMNWLDEAERAGILSTRVFDSGLGEVTGNKRWTGLYIEQAYKQGISRAHKEMEKRGFTPPVGSQTLQSSFANPIHADAVGLLYTRAFNELNGITDAMDQKISRVLAEELVRGESPENVARRLTNEVEGIEQNRARKMARTEIVRAHAEATLNTYESYGLDKVEVKAEWLTAGDLRVCPLCRARAGQVYRIEEMRGQIPLHPLCRCCPVPYVPEGE